LRELGKKSAGTISKSTFQRYKQRWRAEKAGKSGWGDLSEVSPEAATPESDTDASESTTEGQKPFRFTGAEAEVKKRSSPELSSFAKKAMAEAAEWDRKRA
jgi:hypothetical protein